MCGGRESLVVDDVLQTIRDAMQRAAPFPAHDLGFSLTRIPERKLRREAQKRVQVPVVSLDALDERLRIFDGRDFFVPHQGRAFRKAHEGQLGHCASRFRR